MINLKKLTIEQLNELKAQIVAEIESRQQNKTLVIYTHDCKNSAKYHKGKYKHWTKLVKAVDTTKTNGYAFIGEFLNINYEHKIPANSIVVEVCDKDIIAYRATENGKGKITEAKTNSMSGLIETIANEINK